MSLKSLINALFKLSGSQAMPYGIKNSQSVTEDNCNNLSASAPFDGYVVGRFSPENGVICRMYRDTRSVVSGLGNTGGYVDVSFPVRKGQSITAYANNATTSLTVHFEKIVGGGNRLLSQALSWILGGGLCLKTSSENYSRLVGNKHFLVVLQLLSLLNSRVLRSITQLHRMDGYGYRFQPAGHISIYKEMMSLLVLQLLVQIKAHISFSRSLFGKVILQWWVAIYNRQLVLRRHLHPLSVPVNLTAKALEVGHV